MSREDTVLSVAEWYPHFRDFHQRVTAEYPDFDYVWMRQNRPDLYRAMKAKENELDALQEARLSEVMAIMEAWRELVIRADREKKVPDSEQPALLKAG